MRYAVFIAAIAILRKPDMASKVTEAELIKLVPYGLVVTRSWLMKQGLSRHRIDNLVKTGRLVSIAHGVYKRLETRLKWQGVVCSMHRMNLRFVVGGLSALELQGFAHYLPLSEKKTIHLYGQDKLPSWADRLLPEVRFCRHNEKALFDFGARTPEDFTLDSSWGDYEWPFKMSSPERALLEVLQDVPEKVSFEHADLLMQGMTSLSPRRLDKLLSLAKSVKALRLFFWFADRHRHQWRERLNPDYYRLGSGKRVLASGGRLDRKYLITVPEMMDD